MGPRWFSDLRVGPRLSQSVPHADTRPPACPRANVGLALGPWCVVRPARTEHVERGPVLDRCAVPVAGPRDVREACDVKLSPQLVSGAEEEDAGVDAVLAVGEHVVGVEGYPTAADVGDVEPFPQVPYRCQALAVCGLGRPAFPYPVGRVAGLEAKCPTGAHRRGKRSESRG